MLVTHRLVRKRSLGFKSRCLSSKYPCLEERCATIEKRLTELEDASRVEDYEVPESSDLQRIVDYIGEIDRGVDLLSKDVRFLKKNAITKEDLNGFK